MCNLSREDIINLLEENGEKIRSYGVKSLELFGSYAKEEQKEPSDVDLLVEFEEGRGLFEDYIGLKRFLEDILEEEVDLVKKEKVREELKDEILRGDNIGAKL